MSARRVVETARGDDWLSWAYTDEGRQQRRSHALVDDAGAVWLVDPLDGAGLDALIAQLGVVEGVIVLVDRHVRGSVAIATRHDAPVWMPAGRLRQRAAKHARRYGDSIDGAPQFELLPVLSLPWTWVERALWWPEHELLVVGEALGSVSYYRRGRRLPIPIHPLLPRWPRLDLPLDHADVVLVGHGDPRAGAVR